MRPKIVPSNILAMRRRRNSCTCRSGTQSSRSKLRQAMGGARHGHCLAARVVRLAVGFFIVCATTSAIAQPQDAPTPAPPDQPPPPPPPPDQPAPPAPEQPAPPEQAAKKIMVRGRVINSLGK